MWTPEASVGFLVFLTTSLRLSETHTAVPLRGEPATRVWLREINGYRLIVQRERKTCARSAATPVTGAAIILGLSRPRSDWEAVAKPRVDRVNRLP